jgi:hypothetical protein
MTEAALEAKLFARPGTKQGLPGAIGGRAYSLKADGSYALRFWSNRPTKMGFVLFLGVAGPDH